MSDQHYFANFFVNFVSHQSWYPSVNLIRIQMLHQIGSEEKRHWKSQKEGKCKW